MSFTVSLTWFSCTSVVIIQIRYMQVHLKQNESEVTLLKIEGDLPTEDYIVFSCKKLFS